MLLLCLPAFAQGTYLKRVLIFSPSVRDHNSGIEVTFIKEHATGNTVGNTPEFQPLDPNLDGNTPGMSEIWSEQKWANASVSDFQQFDAIVISDTANTYPDGANYPSLLASRAVWGSAINGNIFISGGDPTSDGWDLGHPNFYRIFRQGMRFAAEQAGNAHGRTGLYIALDHMEVGEWLGNLGNENLPTTIPILSWFGNFSAVNVTVNTNTLVLVRLICQNMYFNVIGSDLSGFQGNTICHGFQSWPGSFTPVAMRLTDPSPTPTNTPFYYDPVEAATGYEMCSGQAPVAYILARAVNMGELTRLTAAQPNLAANAGQPVSFTSYSTILPLSNPNQPGQPATQISWRVISGPNAGLSGKCTQQTMPNYGYPLGIWTASYVGNAANITAQNFQDVVQVFMDYNGNAVFDDFNQSGDTSTTDPLDPAPGVTFDYGTTFTVNWALTANEARVSITNLATSVFEGGSAYFQLTRTGSTSQPLPVQLCLGGTASLGYNYNVFVNGVNINGSLLAAIPANSASVNVQIQTINDGVAEGPLTIRMALQDATDGSYVVAGPGYAQMSTIDFNQPNITLTASAPTASEASPAVPSTWTFDTTSTAGDGLKVYFQFTGTADRDVDYHTDLAQGFYDNYGPPLDDDPNPNVIFPDGLARVTLVANNNNPGHYSVTVNLNPYADSRTEGTEAATVKLVSSPSYRFGTASASVNILDNNSPMLPPHSYSITDLGDSYHTSTYAAAINDSAQVAGSYVPYGSPTHNYHAASWNAGWFGDIPSPLGGGDDFLISTAINPGGWTTGYGFSTGGTPFYWLWNGSSTIALQAPGAVVPGYGPSAINDANWLVGSVENYAGIPRTGRWDENGNFSDLGGLSFNPSFAAFAWALSSSVTGNRIAGESQFDLNVGGVTTTAYHAYRTQSGGSPQAINYNTDDLGNVLASDTSSSGAYAINSLCEIAGYSANSGTEMRAAYKDGNSGKNEGWRILGILPGGAGTGLTSQALGMNDAGLIVGWSRSNSGNKAVVWENYQSPSATDLNTKIPTADQANWLLQYAMGINSSGKIVGFGLKNGDQHAFLLTPNP